MYTNSACLLLSRLLRRSQKECSCSSNARYVSGMYKDTHHHQAPRALYPTAKLGINQTELFTELLVYN